MDPSRRFDQKNCDVAIKGGKIAAIQPNIAASSAAETIDAGGKLVVPGLIDIHTHAGRETEDPDLCLADGVTSLVDAGSAGSDGIDAVVAVAKAAPNRMRVLINAGKKGHHSRRRSDGSRQRRLRAMAAAIERHRDVVVGVKVRLSKSVAGDHDLEAVRRARRVAGPLLPMMLHIGQTDSPLPEILALLNPGDIVTHIYAPPPNGSSTMRGTLLPEVRRRGRAASGSTSATAATVTSPGRSSSRDARRSSARHDLVGLARPAAPSGLRLANVVSKFLMLGMPLDQAIACVTSTPRRSGVHRSRHTRAGAPADVAVFELREGDVEFVDNVNAKRTGTQLVVDAGAVFGGQRRERLVHVDSMHSRVRAAASRRPSAQAGPGCRMNVDLIS